MAHTDRPTHIHTYMQIHKSQYTETDRHTDRYTDKHIHGNIQSYMTAYRDIQADRQTEIEIQKHTYIKRDHTDLHTCRHTESQRQSEPDRDTHR